MDHDQARQAAVHNALARIEPGMTLGLGSGRAVFALTEAIGARWPEGAPLTAVVASPETAQRAANAQIPVVELTNETSIDLAFDGADEIDPNFAMIKGGGAALLPEKLVLASSRHVVILVEQNKMVDRLGSTRLLPVEIVRFGWSATQARLAQLVPSIALRMVGEQPVVTGQDHYLVDVGVPDRPLPGLAEAIKLTLGVVEHGLFLDQADEIIVGQSDGTIQIRTRD